MRPTLDRQWYDFLFERAGVSSGGSPAMAFESKPVERLTIEAIFPGEHLSPYELTEARNAKACRNSLTEWTDADSRPFMQCEIREHRYARHALNTPRNYQILRPGHNGLCREVYGLLRTPALTINCHCGNSVWKS